eukprot:UN34254
MKGIRVHETLSKMKRPENYVFFKTDIVFEKIFFNLFTRNKEQLVTAEIGGSFIYSKRTHSILNQLFIKNVKM